MIERLVIRNLKRFRDLDCMLAEHLVIVGPNNCGKTTLLQAIAFWSEIASHWAEYNPDLVRDKNGDYPSSNLNRLMVSSMPLADWDHLWPARDVTNPASIRLYIDGHGLGFELLYRDRDSVHVRPTRDVSESVLERYIQDPLIPVYVPPMSGVDLREPRYGPEVIPARLARGQGGTVLRNLLLGVSGDAGKWREFNEIVSDLFGYELTLPSAGAEIQAGYREGPETWSLDYSSGAAGFLQIVMVYAAIFQRDRSVMLIDEPDAHLHIFLQERLYRDLRERARCHGWQLIIATHSERVIREARVEDLRLLAGGLYKIQHAPRLVDVLHLDNVDLLQAQQVGRILYVEGKTDLEILRAWSTVLKHPLCRFLEAPFWEPTADNKWKAVKHFAAMQLSVPTLRGVELRDRNDKGEGVGEGSCPEGMSRLVWDRYEIENYLIHPAAILRWLQSRGDAAAVDRAERHMKLHFPLGIYEAPFETDYFEGGKGKKVLGAVCEAALIRVGEAEYYGIAAGMRREEVHPEVVEKLDAMAEQLGIADGGKA